MFESLPNVQRIMSKEMLLEWEKRIYSIRSLSYRKTKHDEDYSLLSEFIDEKGFEEEEAEHSLSNYICNEEIQCLFEEYLPKKIWGTLCY